MHISRHSGVYIINRLHLPLNCPRSGMITSHSSHRRLGAVVYVTNELRGPGLLLSVTRKDLK